MQEYLSLVCAVDFCRFDYRLRRLAHCVDVQQNVARETHQQIKHDKHALLVSIERRTDYGSAEQADQSVVDVVLVEDDHCRRTNYTWQKHNHLKQLCHAKLFEYVVAEQQAYGHNDKDVERKIHQRVFDTQPQVGGNVCAEKVRKVVPSESNYFRPRRVVVVLKRHENTVEVDNYVKYHKLQQRKSNHRYVKQRSALLHGRFFLDRTCGI